MSIKRHLQYQEYLTLLDQSLPLYAQLLSNGAVCSPVVTETADRYCSVLTLQNIFKRMIYER